MINKGLGTFNDMTTLVVSVRFGGTGGIFVVDLLILVLEFSLFSFAGIVDRQGGRSQWHCSGKVIDGTTFATSVIEKSETFNANSIAACDVVAHV